MSPRHHNLVGESGKELAKIVESVPTFVRYHMPGCGHCIAMEKDWDKLRNAGHEGIEFVNVESSALAHIPDHLKEGVEGFPTLISYAKDGTGRLEYKGERTAEAMEDWLKEHGRIGKQSGGSRRSRKGGRSRRSRRSHHNSRSSRRHTRRTRGRHSSKRRSSRRAGMRR